MRKLLPLFLDLSGREVLLVGGGRVAAGKLQQLLAAGAAVRVVAPLVVAEIAATPGVEVVRRAFEPADLDGVWLVVASGTPDVNRQVANAAEARRVFVNAVDDPPNATAYLSGVVRRADVTIAISTSGDAPALTALLREALDAVLPHDLAGWIATARRERLAWRQHGVPMDERKPLLLQALNRLYEDRRADRHRQRSGGQEAPSRTEGQPTAVVTQAFRASPAVPWLSAPEDSWL